MDPEAQEKLKFTVADDVFDLLGNLCFGVVVARGMENKGEIPDIAGLLGESSAAIRERFEKSKVKEDPRLLPYREAFRELGFNPNRFMSSIEAMLTRIAKGGAVPHINSAVDLANAVSLRHLTPIGAHDVQKLEADMTVRFSEPGDRFVPFGSTEVELLGPGELIYTVGNQVKTRRWIWRQSEVGKVTSESSHIFFPIDGFKGRNDLAVLAARDELAQLCRRFFQCEATTAFVDRSNRTAEL